jgi:hypothetical protein
MLIALCLLLNFPAWSAAGVQPLHLVFPAKSALTPAPTVAFELHGSSLDVTFDVQTDAIHAREHLGQGEYPFQFDVVEIFVTTSATRFPYYEIELSPYDEDFQVKIRAPKRFENGVNLGVQHSVQRNGGHWTATVQIPLAAIGWTGDPKKIIGNAFAILGEGKARSYYSLFLKPQKKPNFHQPQEFRPLLP